MMVTNQDVGCRSLFNRPVNTVNERLRPFPERDIEANANVTSLGQMDGFMKVMNPT